MKKLIRNTHYISGIVDDGEKKSTLHETRSLDRSQEETKIKPSPQKKKMILDSNKQKQNLFLPFPQSLTFSG